MAVPKVFSTKKTEFYGAVTTAEFGMTVNKCRAVAIFPVVKGSNVAAVSAIEVNGHAATLLGGSGQESAELHNPQIELWFCDVGAETNLFTIKATKSASVEIRFVVIALEAPGVIAATEFKAAGGLNTTATIPAATAPTGGGLYLGGIWIPGTATLSETNYNVIITNSEPKTPVTGIYSVQSHETKEKETAFPYWVCTASTLSVRNGAIFSYTEPVEEKEEKEEAALEHVVFNGDFETGDLSQYAEVQANAGKVSIHSDTPAQGKYYMRSECEAGEPAVAAGIRSEAISGMLYTGGERWFKWKFRNEEFNISTPWELIWQLHDESGGSPPVTIEIYPNAGKEWLYFGNGAATKTFYRGAAPEKNVWHTIIVRVKFSTTAGEVSLRIDGKDLVLEGGKTSLTGLNTIGETHAYDKIGLHPATAMVGKSKASYDEYRVYDVDPDTIGKEEPTEPEEPIEEPEPEEPKEEETPEEEGGEVEPPPIVVPPTTAGEILEHVRSLGYERDTEAQQLVMLSQIQKRILNARRWTFLLSKQTKSTTANQETVEYESLDKTRRIDSVRLSQNGDPLELEYLEVPVLRQYVHDNPTPGVPQYWARMGKNLLFYPIPDGAYSVEIDDVENPKKVEHAADAIQIPASHTEILTWGIIMQISARERDWDMHEHARQMYAELFTEMLAQYGMKQRGQSTHVTSSGEWENFDVEDNWPITLIG